jgi:hypothetical protein
MHKKNKLGERKERKKERKKEKLLSEGSSFGVISVSTATMTGLEVASKNVNGGQPLILLLCKPKS